MSARWLNIAGTLKYEGDWRQPCQRVIFAISEHDNFIDDNALRDKALVIMNLQGSGLDPTLTLYESDRNGTVGTELASNDNNPNVPTLDSRLHHYLGPGHYLVEARLKFPNTASRDRKLILQWEGVPHSGAHQSDHTVAYRMGTVTADQRETGDLARAALKEGAKEWNKAGGATSTWPYLLYCETSCDENTDDNVVTVEIVGSSGCKDSVACASVGFNEEDHIEEDHIATLTIKIEHPPVIKKRPAKWTDDSSLHNVFVNFENLSEGKHFHMLTAILHEMGHALGLDDLYGDVAGNFTGYLMGSLSKHDAATSVPYVDRALLKRVYRVVGHK